MAVPEPPEQPGSDHGDDGAQTELPGHDPEGQHADEDHQIIRPPEQNPVGVMNTVGKFDEDIVDLLDLDSLELTQDSFVDRRLRQHYSDLLYRLKFKDGRPGFVYFLLEHKRSPKRFTALQLLRYRVQIWEKALAQGIGTEGLPPII